MRGYVVLGDERRLGSRGHCSTHSVDNLPAASIVEGDEENHAPVTCCKGLGPLHLRQQVLVQLIPTANEHHSAVVSMQSGDLAIDHLPVQPHQAFDLICRPVPVLGGEGVESELADPGVASRFDHPTHGLRPRPVACDHGEMATARPTAVAVHDDGHMERNPTLRPGLGPVRSVLPTAAPKSIEPVPYAHVRSRGSPLPYGGVGR